MLIQRKVLTPAHRRMKIGSILRLKVPHQARARLTVNVTMIRKTLVFD
jgi:hypothetical protein